MSEERKTKCVNRNCKWTGRVTEVMESPNPFNAEDTIVGCPKCKDVNCLVYACDFEGCWKNVSSGTPTCDGYKNTCYEHIPEKRV